MIGTSKKNLKIMDNFKKMDISNFHISMPKKTLSIREKEIRTMQQEFKSINLYDETIDTRYQMNEKGEVYNSKTERFLKANKDFIRMRLKETKEMKSLNVKRIYSFLYGKPLNEDDVVKDLEGEIWREIKFKDIKKGYWISNKGRIKSRLTANEKILKQSNVDNYFKIQLLQNQRYY